MSERIEGFLVHLKHYECYTMPPSFGLTIAVPTATGLPSRIKQLPFGYIERQLTEEAFEFIRQVASGVGRLRKWPIVVECDKFGMVNLVCISHSA